MGDDETDPWASALDQGVGTQGGCIAYRVYFRQKLLSAHIQLFTGTVQCLVEAQRQVLVASQGLGL